jgi:hypothetical protein
MDDAGSRSGIDDEFLYQLGNIVETLVNLNFLAQVEADKPDLVRHYCNQSEERLRDLCKLITPIRLKKLS